METGLRVLLLTLVAATLGGCASVRNWLDRDPPAQPQTVEEETEASAAEESDSPPPRVIDPQVERRQIKTAKIDTENLEIAAHFGMLSVEDFGTNPVHGFSLSYHVSEDFFMRAEFGRTTAGRTSFETLAGNIQLLTGDERRFTYYNLALGYNFLPGEVFLGRSRAMTSTFYVIGGIGSTEFAGDERFTASFGAGYRVLPSDWLSLHIGVQDRVFDSDLLGTTKLTNNLETHIGVSVFF